VSFFDAGGNSLLTLKLYMAMQEELGAPFLLRDLFRYPTARSFASRPGVIAKIAPVTSGVANSRRVQERAATIANRQRSIRRPENANE
jgi:hypothetical protein